MLAFWDCTPLSTICIPRGVELFGAKRISVSFDLHI
jgi:hypothetical protein